MVLVRDRPIRSATDDFRPFKSSFMLLVVVVLVVVEVPNCSSDEDVAVVGMLFI